MSKFRADCSQCCGLCCVVPDQLTEQGFPEDKAANTPCKRLNEQHRCAIYAHRRFHGFTACAGFDCYGAGQWVRQQLFAGADWRQSAELANKMFAAYRHWLPRFRAAALIEAALPHVRSDAHASLSALMIELVSRDGMRGQPETDSHWLLAETLALIRRARRQPGHTHESS